MISRRAFIEGVVGCAATAAVCSSISVEALADEAHFNDASIVGDSKDWSSWTDGWSDLAADYTKVSIAPGKDETMINFAWYSPKVDGQDPTPIVCFGTDEKDMTEFKGVAGPVDNTLTGGADYFYNHVTVTGLEQNTTYSYAVENNGVQGDTCTYTTGSFDTLKIVLVGDPQVGASKGQTQGSTELAEDDGAANTAACNDGFSWNRSVTTFLGENPDTNFIISAGDQINKTGKPKEEEYAGFLAATGLASCALATAIGNHDSLNPDYRYHFYTPNALNYGLTAAGGDYYYTYGDVLFIVLNTNNYEVAEHEAAIEEAVNAAPDKKWRILTMHQDIYGTGADHSATDGMILRTQLTPILDAYDIDVVLQGHDHTYARSLPVQSDGGTHDSYEFLLNSDGSDYDWDHVHDKTTDTLIPLAPDATDTQGASELAAFQDDNLCYTTESVDGDSISDPKGVLCIAANSGSGSKYYELIENQQDYVVVRSQNYLPSYSVITIDSSSFAVTTYQIKEDGSVEPIDDTFTITKSA